jgi:hypothetical protein
MQLTQSIYHQGMATLRLSSEMIVKSNDTFARTEIYADKHLGRQYSYLFTSLGWQLISLRCHLFESSKILHTYLQYNITNS